MHVMRLEFNIFNDDIKITNFFCLLFLLCFERQVFLCPGCQLQTLNTVDLDFETLIYSHGPRNCRNQRLALLPQFSFYSCDKDHDQKQLLEKGVYLAKKSQSAFERSQGRNQEAKQEVKQKLDVKLFTWICPLISQFAFLDVPIHSPRDDIAQHGLDFFFSNNSQENALQTFLAMG